MKPRYTLLFLTLLLCLTLSACREEPKEPPDLRGEWQQVLGDDAEPDYYHLARITDEYIEIYYYSPSDGSTNLYWYGSYEPPEDGKEPYTWTSETKLPPISNPRLFRYASRDATRDFTYKKGLLTYTIAPSQALRMSVTLERAPEEVEIRGEVPLP